jgi:sulfotransferase family protein
MKTVSPFSDYKFLILGGTSRAGTTSVFTYLENHPQITCSSVKETGFFLDADYPFRSKKRYQKHGPQAYLSFFESEGSHPEESWRFEASPGYLYSPNTPDAIRRTLGNVRFIFILREPLSRLLSWYRLGQSMNEIPSRMTFDDYVAIQREIGDSFPNRYRYQAFGALRQGRYSMYLERYFEAFGASSIQILFYEELRRDPFSFMVKLCGSVGIDGTYFQGYTFKVVNKGPQVRSQWLHRAYFEANLKLNGPARRTPKPLRRVLRQVQRGVHAAYGKLNVTKERNVTMSPSTKDFILSYYQDEPARLKEMLGIEVPWPSNPSAALAGFEINSVERRAE